MQIASSPRFVTAQRSTWRRQYLAFVAAAAAAFLVWPGGAVGTAATRDGTASRALSQCIKASNGVTSEMKACLHAEYNRLDRQLNATYRSVMRQLPTQDLRTRLVNAQRAWIWRRDHNCQLRADSSGAKGGTAADLIQDDCLVTTVRQRIEWLRKVPANPGYLSKV